MPRRRGARRDRGGPAPGGAGMAAERKSSRSKAAPAKGRAQPDGDEVTFSFAPALLQAWRRGPLRESDTLDVFIAFRPRNGTSAKDLLAAQLKRKGSHLRVLLDDAWGIARERHVAKPYGVDFAAKGRSPFVKYDPD